MNSLTDFTDCGNSMQDAQTSSVTIAYATPGPTSGSGVAAGVWITLAGLALIFLGGCFCIGVMLSLNVGNITGGGSLNPVNITFVVMMSVLAFACFAAAVFVLVLGIRKLLAVGRA